MAIDHSLAKGLATSLIKNWQSKIQERYRTALKTLPKIDTSKRSNFDKFIRLHREAFKDTSIAFFYGGSKRNPLIANVTMLPNKGRRYGDWDENALGGMVELEWIKDFDSDDKFRPLGFFVGEHALTRIYQRSFHQEEGSIIDPFKITDQLKLVPLWTAFWVILILLVAEYIQDDISLIEPIIPSEDGLFLCKTSDIPTNPKLRMLEIRTYINQHHFDSRQAHVHQIMFAASQSLEESILSIYPYEDEMDEYQNFLSRVAFDLMLHRVVDHIDEISDMVLLRHGDFRIYKFREAVRIIYSSRHNLGTDSLDAYLKQGGRLNDLATLLIKTARKEKLKEKV
jgi:hypothetical protein